MNQPAVEALLCEAYRQQAESYAAAAESMRRARAAWAPGADLPTLLQPVVLALEQVARIDAASQAARRWWQQDGRKPGPALQASLRGTWDGLNGRLDIRF